MMTRMEKMTAYRLLLNLRSGPRETCVAYNCNLTVPQVRAALARSVRRIHRGDLIDFDVIPNRRGRA